MKKIIKQFLRIILKLLSKSNKIKKIDNTNVHAILVLAYTGIGNFILYIPTLKLLRKEFPNAKITLQYGNSTGCEYMTMKSNIFDEYIELNRDKSLVEFIKYGFKNRNKYDLVISEFHNNSWKLAFGTALLKASYKIGHISGEDWKSSFDFLYNFPIKMKENDHEIRRYLKLLEPLNIYYDYEIEKLNTEVFLSSENYNNANNFLSKLDKSKKTLGIQIGTSQTMRWKQWPLGKYKELVMKLKDNFNIILIGAPNERTMIEELVIDVISENIFIYAGDGSLLDASALISKLDSMVTADSGLMHIANAFDVNLIAIYGPTDFSRTAPLGKNAIVIKKDYECMPCFTMSGDETVENCKYSYKCLVDIPTEMVYKNILKELL